VTLKIVITGALGHIGSHISRDLAVQFPGSELVLIDNMMTQRFPSLFNLPKLAQYRFIEADIRQLDLRPILKDAQVVIHLAAITDAANSFKNATLLEENNYESTLKVLEACSETGTNLILLSSTSVYGTQKLIVSEDCSPEDLNPQSPYAITKIREEELVKSFVKEKNLRAIICRFGTIYGTSPGMRFHTAVNKFCWQATMGNPLTVWSTAYEQQRPYLDLVDAGRAFTFIIRNDLFDGQIYNVLSQNSSVRQIIEVIRDYVPEIEIEFVESMIMNQLSYKVSCEKFESKGFKFVGELHRGISETINLLRQSNSLAH
jgi:UDP-glucose 4-epimerase